MLNLLIAIISDSFEKVMAIDKQAALYEKLQLIVEIKRKRKRQPNIFAGRPKERNFLCVLSHKEHEEEQDVFEERIRNKILKIDKSLDSLKKSMSLEIKETRAEIKEIKSDIKQFISGNKESQGEVRKEIKELNIIIQEILKSSQIEKNNIPKSSD